MRVTEARVIRAIRKGLLDPTYDGRLYKSGNTEVLSVHEGIYGTHNYNHCIEIYLHNNNIATLEADNGRLTIRDCGWQTVTTKSRLNCLLRALVGPGHGIYQKNFSWFFNDRPWEGSATANTYFPLLGNGGDNYALRLAYKLAPL